jgi:hypothetical protein
MAAEIVASNSVITIKAFDSEGFYNVDIAGLGTVECRHWSDQSIVAIAGSTVPPAFRAVAEELARLALLDFLG